MEPYAAIAGYLAAIQQLPEWKKVDYGADAIIHSWSHKHCFGHARGSQTA